MTCLCESGRTKQDESGFSIFIIYFLRDNSVKKKERKKEKGKKKNVTIRGIVPGSLDYNTVALPTEL